MFMQDGFADIIFDEPLDMIDKANEFRIAFRGHGARPGQIDGHLFENSAGSTRENKDAI